MIRPGILSALFLAATAACAPQAARNPDNFTFSLRDGTISGSYSPRGFTGVEVKREAGAACMTGRVADYTEGPGKDGLVRFTAHCLGTPALRAGAFLSRRMADQSIDTGAIGL